ncbi:MAG TPA: hypothetical protein VNU48_01375 [Burkholderiaceae bacterium]|nr:hypothetical protein [Burkholderiaceae bacterium]
MLFRRREVWLPTMAGWLLIVAAALLLVGALAVRAYDLLAPQKPAHGHGGEGARTLVVEGWLTRAELQQAAALLREGHYQRVLTTGGPIPAEIDAGGWQTFAQRAAELLRAEGVAGVPVIAVPAPASMQERSYLSAVMVRDWARRSGAPLVAIDLYSAGTHARRSWLLYRMALGDAVEVGVLAARPTDHDARRWWTNSEGVKTTIGETLSLTWTRCCFWPGAPGSSAERLVVPVPARP